MAVNAFNNRKVPASGRFAAADEGQRGQGPHILPGENQKPHLAYFLLYSSQCCWMFWRGIWKLEVTNICGWTGRLQFRLERPPLFLQLLTTMDRRGKSWLTSSTEMSRSSSSSFPHEQVCHSPYHYQEWRQLLCALSKIFIALGGLGINLTAANTVSLILLYPIALARHLSTNKSIQKVYMRAEVMKKFWWSFTPQIFGSHFLGDIARSRLQPLQWQAGRGQVPQGWTDQGGGVERD